MGTAQARQKMTVTMYGRELPIPYVAAWSSEMDGEWEIRPCTTVCGRPAWFAKNGGIGIGKPLLGKMDPFRVRHVIDAEECQVCRKRLGKHRFVPLIGHGEPSLNLVSEPWACRDCAAMAAQFCPGIKRRQCGWVRLLDWRITCAMTVDPSWDPESGTPRPDHPVAYGYSHIQVLNYEPVKFLLPA